LNKPQNIWERLSKIIQTIILIIFLIMGFSAIYIGRWIEAIILLSLFGFLYTMRIYE